MRLEEYKVDVPEAECGGWKVGKYTVSQQEEDFQKLRCAFNPQRPARYVPAGTYTMLTRNGTMVMSDTPDEIRDHLPPILNTPEKGHCLVGGLGLGMVTEAMLKKSPDVRVTVVELCEEVIELVGTHLKARYGDRLEIIHADVMKWKPPRGTTYDVVWMDIWDDIDMDNLSDMKKLMARSYAKNAPFKGCWQQSGCEGQRDRISSGRGLY